MRGPARRSVAQLARGDGTRDPEPTPRKAPERTIRPGQMIVDLDNQETFGDALRFESPVTNRAGSRSCRRLSQKSTGNPGKEKRDHQNL